MANWTSIADATLEPGKPIRAIDARALRDNPIAIAEGASGAPKIETAGITDLNVTTAKLAAGAVTTAKITDANVTTAKLEAGERMTTANVLGATAGASAGAVGTYMLGWLNSTATPPAFGATVAGSGLRPAGFTGDVDVLGNLSFTKFVGAGTGDLFGSAGSLRSVQSGTWRCMGEARQVSGSAGSYPHTLWLRIS
jgi:hypothetical protein